MFQLVRHFEHPDEIQSLGNFSSFLKKKYIHFNVIWITFQTFLSPLEKNKVAEIKNLFEILKFIRPFSPLYLQIKLKPRLNVLSCDQARSKKFAMGEGEGNVLGSEPPAAGDTPDWGLSPQHSKILHFFAKIT